MNTCWEPRARGWDWDDEVGRLLRKPKIKMNNISFQETYHDLPLTIATTTCVMNMMRRASVILLPAPSPCKHVCDDHPVSVSAEM